MLYHVVDLGSIPEGISEDELDCLVERRKGTHALRTEAAACLQAMTAFGSSGRIPKRSCFDHLSEELAGARRSHEFVRRTLVEQAVLAKSAIAELMLKLTMAYSVEAANAYSAALSRLQSELRRNLKCLAELPLDTEPPTPTKKYRTEDQIYEHHLRAAGTTLETTTETHEEKIDVDTELASKPDGRPEPASEAEEPATGRSWPPEPATSPRTQRYGPPTAPGGSHEEPALGTLHRPEDAAGQSPGRQKRASRRGRVASIDSSGIGSCHEAVDRHAETTARAAELCTLT